MERVWFSAGFSMSDGDGGFFIGHGIGSEMCKDMGVLERACMWRLIVKPSYVGHDDNGDGILILLGGQACPMYSLLGSFCIVRMCVTNLVPLELEGRAA